MRAPLYTEYADAVTVLLMVFFTAIMISGFVIIRNDNRKSTGRACKGCRKVIEGGKYCAKCQGKQQGWL